MTKTFFQGQTGILEGRLTQGGHDVGAALCCHPHPLYGGSLADPVVAELVAAVSPYCKQCLRFNFRGVGESEGFHDAGQGETDDVISASAWLAQEGCIVSTLCGYSFGAQMALAAAATIQVQTLILVAPPLSEAIVLTETQRQAETVVVVGDQDSYMDINALNRTFGAKHIRVIAGADHFFSAHRQSLARILKDHMDGA
ncbi:MAG: hypothetical protein HOL98_04595 [Gammaproteobacteria bacterium]|jgi:uncharacterized protein|nr:hypothetical protein [Gammaproteobacteria bacterium]MBT5202715.1 hypothetical protein [Gammaproteobacteria bacterium]MBT5602115.1 hypothetical protein [Gammaproteobacteria bacterium]MBT6245738.1 hypothetical protein [Gammaproteobacteria bacterium]